MPAIEAVRKAGYGTMNRLATRAMDPGSVELEREFASAQAFEAAVGVLGKEGEERRGPFVRKNLPGGIVLENLVHGLEFLLLATDARPF